ncbi:hypothetical protein D1007_18957 [Hordeum vulgare]|nr:hypothetical protein D1007_18957 [Hordeum vulgare]
MDKIVNIHYVDKEAFMNVDIVDKYEEVLTFLDSPTYEEVVAETRIRLKWVDPSDQVELLGRYDVGSAHKCRMKTMSIKSNLHWVAYKEAVASSIDKSLEVFASTVVNAPLHVDLNQPLVDDLSSYNGVAPIVEHKVEVQVNEYPQYKFGGNAPIKDDGHDSDEEYEGQHNIVGDIEAQVRHDDMDPDIVYQRACVDESDDEGPVNELDEDGFTEKEAECTSRKGWTVLHWSFFYADGVAMVRHGATMERRRSAGAAARGCNGTLPEPSPGAAMERRRSVRAALKPPGAAMEHRLSCIEVVGDALKPSGAAMERCRSCTAALSEASSLLQWNYSEVFDR